MNVLEWSSFRGHATAVVRERAIIGDRHRYDSVTPRQRRRAAVQAGTRALQPR
jgi:hypothetical protein